MMRSPIFILIAVFFAFSCKQNNKIKYDTLINASDAKKHLELGEEYFLNQKYDTAFYYYNKSNDAFKIKKDSASITFNLIRIAQIQQTYGDYSGSEESLVEALIYNNKNITYKSEIYNSLGISSKELSNYNDAINYYNTVLKIANDTLSRVTPTNNIALVYIEKGNYLNAIKLLEPISKLPLLDTIENKKARIIDNLGYSYYKANFNEKGFSLINQALLIRQKNSDSYGIINSYLHLAEYYQNTNKLKSKQNAFDAYKLATKLNSVDERLESLVFLMSYNQEKGQNNYAIQYAHLNDSITKVRNNAKNQFAKIKYDSRSAIEENLKLKNKNTETDLKLQKQKNQTDLFVFGFLSLLGGIVYVYSHFKNKNKHERIQAAYNTEIRIAKKLHDELANDVYQTMVFTETQDLSNDDKKEVLLNNLEKIYVRTRNISQENNTIDTGVNFSSNLKKMLSNYQNEKVNIIINDNNKIDWSKIQDSKKIDIHRTLQELMVNMKKHSLCSHVLIGFEASENNITIEYKDNGKGCDVTQISKNGLQNVENRILANNGTITFDSQIDNGFKASIKFLI
ncbi:hypothetical protein [Flavobacterium sp.]|uniref:tetratricopeptide repeat-containing sensor histidine kinase n=1 Tax=Flavobacterium sp. TaxID=239 RepID=UPI00286E5BE5|nr:hypothetical protein [Flavobacterium sp.]